jgi:hypothetical protein
MVKGFMERRAGADLAIIMASVTNIIVLRPPISTWRDDAQRLFPPGFIGCRTIHP